MTSSRGRVTLALLALLLLVLIGAIVQQANAEDGTRPSDAPATSAPAR